MAIRSDVHGNAVIHMYMYMYVYTPSEQLNSSFGETELSVVSVT